MTRVSLSRRPRQTDIARFAGVSVSTVSRVLANEPGISTNVRDQVIRIASELGYSIRPVPAVQPQNPRAVALIPVDQATGGLGVFYEGILGGLRGAAARTGGTLLPRLVRSSSLKVSEIEQTLSETDATGIFLVGIDPPEDLCEWLLASKLPTVWVNGNDPNLQFDCVSPANFYGARLATQHLIDAGHRRILHFTMSHRHTIRERVRGFEAAAAKNGVATRIVQLPPGSRTSSDACEAMEAILQEDQGFTAVFCMNDMMAVGVMEALTNHHMSIPQDFAVMGFDDLPCAAMTMPRLTTMHVDREAIGQEAYWLMQRRIADPSADPRKVELAVRLVEGATVQAHTKPSESEETPA
ncbi:LacI family DNA-binding transcriptional regulator [Microvirga mediterraneensis]|uniref:LacI family DNA-binding transcriptional regulator n=1 Tax=Microvirga mediterraneensis TaxID=2754695 RepID=A0A838BRN7_9HYPH|nr:LacI family DNA-binding transcriptional regulator [Microvirga mediterraneensis]MBA1157583.1 LacI family DNA-binding transcriptional regulator [Microvirga mediterraneensis]